LPAFEKEATYGTLLEQEYNGLEAHLADIGAYVIGSQLSGLYQQQNALF
jgi:hypothetical protein